MLNHATSQTLAGRDPGPCVRRQEILPPKLSCCCTEASGASTTDRLAAPDQAEVAGRARMDGRLLARAAQPFSHFPRAAPATLRHRSEHHRTFEGPAGQERPIVQPANWADNDKIFGEVRFSGLIFPKKKRLSVL